MLKMNKYILITVLLFTLLITIDANAQCAMCKAIVESNLENGDTVGTGLNDGILLLNGHALHFSCPYCLFLIRHNKFKNKSSLQKIVSLVNIT